MMYNEVIKLARSTSETDESGNEVYSTREVMASVRSIGMREFYEAATSDFKPDCKAILADYRDFEGERILVWNQEVYRIIRTYRNGRQLELTLEHKIGDDDIVFDDGQEEQDGDKTLERI